VSRSWRPRRARLTARLGVAQPAARPPGGRGRKPAGRALEV